MAEFIVHLDEPVLNNLLLERTCQAAESALDGLAPVVHATPEGNLRIECPDSDVSVGDIQTRLQRRLVVLLVERSPADEEEESSVLVCPDDGLEFDEAPDEPPSPAADPLMPRHDGPGWGKSAKRWRA